MASIFAGGQQHNGGFRADQLRVSFGGESVKGLLVQDVNFNFSQQLAMLYEIGSPFVYYVGGRSQGSAGISQIVGPASRAPLLLTRFRDLCNPQDISFDATAGCGVGQVATNGSGLRHTLIDAVLVGLAVGVTAQNVVINRNLNFMYIDLDVDAVGETPVSPGFVSPAGVVQTPTGDGLIV